MVYYVLLRETVIVTVFRGWCRDGAVVRAPMCPGFNSQIWHQMWVEFVGSLLCTERFSPGTRVPPLLKNQNLT